jgi:zinc protease
VRPVVPAIAHFAVRAAIYEVDRLIRDGIGHAEFVLARDFLVGYSKLWARSLGDRLGFHLDSRFFGMPYFIDEIDRRLKAATVDDVNRAIRTYLQTDRFAAVVVTDDAAAFRNRLLEDRPSPIQYEQTVAADVLAADERIATLPVRPADVRIVPVAETFVTTRSRP